MPTVTEPAEAKTAACGQGLARPPAQPEAVYGAALRVKGDGRPPEPFSAGRPKDVPRWAVGLDEAPPSRWDQIAGPREAHAILAPPPDAVGHQRMVKRRREARGRPARNGEKPRAPPPGKLRVGGLKQRPLREALGHANREGAALRGVEVGDGDRERRWRSLGGAGARQSGG